MVQLSGTIKDATIIRAKTLEVKLSAPNGKMQLTFGECQLEVGSEEEQAARMAKLSERPGKRTSAAAAGEGRERPAGGTNGAT